MGKGDRRFDWQQRFHVGLVALLLTSARGPAGPVRRLLRADRSRALRQRAWTQAKKKHSIQVDFKIILPLVKEMRYSQCRNGLLLGSRDLF